jgi:hypothetical protein
MERVADMASLMEYWKQSGLARQDEAADFRQKSKAQ